MSGQPFVLSMVFKSDVSSAKAGLQEVSTSLRQVSDSAAAAKGQTAMQAAELERLAAKAVQATKTADELALAEKRRVQAAFQPLNAVTASGPSVNTMAVWRSTETAAASLHGAVKGLSASIGDQAHATVAAAQSTQIWQSALDEVRARFNPLFAASQQYQNDLREIAEAERLGAISAREAAAARETAAKRMAPAIPGAVGGAPANISSMHTANVAAQGFDIGVTAAMGMNPMMIGMQQGTQLVQVMQQMGGGKQALQGIATGFMSILNPMSLVTIGMVALGALGLQQLGKLVPKTKSFDEAMQDLSGAVSAADKHLKIARASTSDLASQFGSAAAAARNLSAAMAEIEERRAMRGATDAINALQKEHGLWLVDPSWQNEDPNADNEAQLFEARRDRDRAKMRKMFDLDRSAESRGLIDSFLNAATNFDLAKDLDQRIAAVEQLKSAWEAAESAASGQTKESEEFFSKIVEAGLELAKLEGQRENAAGKAAAGDMTRQLERQAAVQAVIARYGQESAQARALEIVQQKMATAEKLRGLGFDSKSVEFRRAMGAIDADFAARAQIERTARQRDHDDQLAQIARERQLLGATTAERLRAKAIAEAEIEIRDRSLTGLDAMLERWRAIARASAEAGVEQARAARELQIGLVTDAYDARIGLARDPLTKADLEGQREYTRVLHETNDAERAAAEGARVRTRSMTEALTATRNSMADMLDEVQIRQQVSAQVAAGTLAASDANRVIQQELQLRPLIAAAARAEGAEKQRLTEIITGLRIAHEAQAAEERRQSQNDYLRGAAERVQQAKLELALIGQTAQVRARVVAMVQAERDIRAQGLTGAAADDVRSKTRELVALNGIIASQADAWQTVQSAGEAAIDAVLDKLKGGDIKGAFAGLLDELNKGFFDLGVRNPLKNLLLGTNLGTLDDVGGLSGIWDRLTGKAPLNEQSVIAAASRSVQAMTISASAVTINTASLGLAGAQSLLSGMPGVANIGNAPGAAVSQLGGGDVPAQMWAFFAQKGLKPHHIAGILGNAAGESGFNPLAVGDGGDAHGLFQWNDRRHKLFDFIGGRGNLGNVQGQLEFAWRELMTTENKAFKRLMASTDVRGATDAFMRGFERPSEKAMNDSFGARLGAAEAALSQFGMSAQTATTDLSTLGSGMDGLGSALANAIGGAAGGQGGSWISALIQLGGKALNVPGFERGGETGGSDPSKIAGVVHEREYVFDADSTARIGVRNLEALRRGSLRGFRSGGYVSAVAPSTPAFANAASAGTNIQIHNYTGQPVREETTVDAAGLRNTTVVIGEQIAAAINQPGNAAGKALKQGYNLRKAGVRR